ncbi:hypothetical protein NDU88_005028 [Pleurodeles waltl]|uniref:Uncharacterized protein n=1 Tax=Pleurodeles waltl TaxID=8319 RepID=A0AAV7WBJ6_PLEWA|nr:hypothetical protein NDU88_005028 [Pleurodeles waltl]
MNPRGSSRLPILVTSSSVRDSVDQRSTSFPMCLWSSGPHPRLPCTNPLSRGSPTLQGCRSMNPKRSQSCRRNDLSLGRPRPPKRGSRMPRAAGRGARRGL